MKLNEFKDLNESAMTCSECGGPAFSDLILAEKQDACYNKVKSRYKVWPSAYASGALVQCRKKGAANWGNKSEGVAEGSSQSNLQPGTQVMLWLGPRDMLPQPPRDDKKYWDKGVVVSEPEMMTGSWQVLVKSQRKGQSPISPERVFVLKQQVVAEGTDPNTQSHADAFKSETDTMRPGTKKYVGRKGGKEVTAKKDAQGNVKFYHRDGIKGPLKTVNEMDSQGYKGSRDDYELGKGKEHTGTPVKSKDAAKDAEKILNKSHPKTWHDVDKKLGKAVDKMSQAEKVKKGLAHPDTLKKPGVAEGSEQINELSPETLKSYANKARAQVRSSPGANPNSSHLPTDPKIANRARGAVKADNRLHGFGPAKKSTQGMAEGQEDSPVAQAITRRIMMQRTDLLAKYGPGYVGQAIDDVVDSVGDVEEIGSSDVSGWVRQVEHNLKNKLNQYDEPMNVGDALDEEHNPEYDDEAGMADNNLETLSRAVEGIDELIQSGDNLPEWCQEKIAVAKSMLVAVWDYMYSEEASDEVDPEIDAMFEAMDQLAEEIAARDNIDVDLVWESFESLDDHMLYETAAWRRKEGKSKTGGLNAKGVASYRRENPGSKLQTAVTTKPSKLKPGSKAAKRRKSFCARMSGVKGPMKKPNGKPTRKALALRKWNC